MEPTTNVNPTVPREDRVNFMGYAIVGILCAAAIILGVIGLIRYSIIVSGLTVIVLAIAFLLEGGSLLRFYHVAPRRTETTMQTFEISAEVMGGAAGLVLGILAMTNIVPITLISVAAIVYGASLILGAASHYGERPGTDTGRVSFEILIGVAGIVLGILALLNINPLTMGLIAMIVLSFGTFMIETTLKNRAADMYNPRA